MIIIIIMMNIIIIMITIIIIVIMIITIVIYLFIYQAVIPLNRVAKTRHTYTHTHPYIHTPLTKPCCFKNATTSYIQKGDRGDGVRDMESPFSVYSNMKRKDKHNNNNNSNNNINKNNT